MSNTEYVKKLYVHSEMEAARVWIKDPRPDHLNEILLSFAHPEGGGKWECGIHLIKLGENRTAMKLWVFTDSWMVFEDAPEVFKVLGKFARASNEHDDREEWPKLIAALEKVGWTRVKPEPRLVKPATCHACGRP